MFRQFGIDRYAKFVSNGSIDKIINEDVNYWPKEEYDLVLVDEAHRFRNHRSRAFPEFADYLQGGSTAKWASRRESQKGSAHFGDAP